MQTIDEQEFKQLQRHPRFYLNGGDLHFFVSFRRGDSAVVQICPTRPCLA